MKLSDTDVTLTLMNNPINLHQTVLTDLESKLNSNFMITDPNTPAMHIIEMGTHLTSSFAHAVENEMNSLIAKRAQTVYDLYKHMSDFDYVGLYGSPSMAEISLILDADFIINNAPSFTDNYSKIVIPKDTIFKIGLLDFGLFYPIEIRVNKNTKSFTILYNTEDEVPGHSLNSNIVPFTESVVEPYNLLQLYIPVYQFTKTTLSEPLNSLHGFSKKIVYKDKFHMVRLYTTVNGSTVELSQVLSSGTYDPTVPTARVAIEPDINTFTITIPQIYFTNNQLGTKLTIELYTTQGNLITDISGTSPDQIKINYGLNTKSDQYSKPLSRLSVQQVMVTSTRLAGGSDGYGFEELRERVIHNSFHPSLLVTPMDLENYFQDKDMRILRYEDNLTNLIYFCYKTLIDTSNTIVPTADLPIKLTEEIISNTDTILEQADGTVTILPTTVYNYSHTENFCTPLTTLETDNISKLSKEEQVDLFNTVDYTRSPFHMRLVPDENYPSMSSYNLMNPKVSKLTFEKENTSLTAQMLVLGCGIVHQEQGSAGYKLRFATTKSKDLLGIPEEDIAVYFYTRDVDGVAVGVKLDYVELLNNEFIYETEISTNYNISREHHLGVSSLTTPGAPWQHFIDFESEFQLIFMVDYKHFPTASTELSMMYDVPLDIRDGKIAMTQQSMVVQLGYPLDDVIYNNIDIQWSSQEYARHTTDEYLTYSTDIFRTDSNGVPIYTIEGDQVKFDIEHTKGEVVLGGDGNPLYKYRAGDLMYNDFREPVLVKERVILYYVQAMMVNAKFYMSEQKTHNDYLNSITETLESYFSVIRASTDNLLERDRMYFKPTKTIGHAQFKIGNGVTITLPLNMKFSMRCHLDDLSYLDDDVKESITNIIVSEIETSLSNRSISLTDMVKNIKNSAESIEAIDVLGIEGITDLQTITAIDDSVQPSINQELYLTKNNTIGIRKSVDIEFVSTL